MKMALVLRFLVMLSWLALALLVSACAAATSAGFNSELMATDTPTVPTLAATPASTIVTSTTPAASPTAAPSPTAPAELVGSFETKPDPFNGSNSLDIDGEGNLYVTDIGRDRILKFNRSGTLLKQIGGYGAGDGQFDFGGNGPDANVTIDASGNIYVVDSGNSRIQKLDRDGKFLLKWGSAGYGTGQFVLPLALAVDSQGNLYVAEGSGRVQKFDSSGKFLLAWDGSGSAGGKFLAPTDIDVDANDVVFVADYPNVTIQKFDREGKFLSSWGADCGSHPIQILFAITLDAQSNVYVADKGGQVCKFDADGKFLAQWDIKGLGADNPSEPEGIAVDSQGIVYVVDFANERVLKFRQR